MRTAYGHLLLLLALTGCDGSSATPTSSTLVDSISKLETGILVRTLRPEPELIGLWNPREHSGLRGSGPWTLSPRSGGSSILELHPLPLGGSWSGLTLPLFPLPLPTELVLLPHESLPLSVYAGQLDLLIEFVAPNGGGVVRRWQPESLRIARPLPVAGVDYLGTLENAVAMWNLALGRERLRLVDHGEMAEVICELSEESSLGYVRRLAEDAERHPLRMLIHLSPRWTMGAERYVQRAWLHELGHVLGLWGHSLDPRHVMHGSFIAVDAPHPEELTALTWLWELPHGTHMAWYRGPWGSGAVPEPPYPYEDGKSAGLEAVTPHPAARAGEIAECHPGLR